MNLPVPSRPPRITPGREKTLWSVLLFVLRRVCEAIERKLLSL